MYLFRLKNSPYVIRYYPNYRKSMFQYHKVDQNPNLFGFDANGVMRLTHFCVPVHCFYSLVDVYFFLTSYKCIIPSNLENAFEIRKYKNVWTSVKRPFLYAPSLHCQPVRQVQAQE